MADLTAYNAMLNDHAKRVEKLREEAQGQLRIILQDFMVKNQSIRALTWTQYTPHFNDGDECTFGVNELEIVADGIEGDYHEVTINGEEFTASGIPWGTSADAYKEFVKVLGQETTDSLMALNGSIQSSGDVLKAAFGDHCQIIVTQDGIEVEEYDHD